MRWCYGGNLSELTALNSDACCILPNASTAWSLYTRIDETSHFFDGCRLHGFAQRLRQQGAVSIAAPTPTYPHTCRSRTCAFITG